MDDKLLVKKAKFTYIVNDESFKRLKFGEFAYNTTDFCANFPNFRCLR